MDNDQFGGRTDDDLFADDYEPYVPEDQTTPPAQEPAPPTPPAPAASQPSVITPAAPTTSASSNQPAPSTQSQPPPKSLAQSRHNRPDNNGPRPSSKNARHGNNRHKNNNATQNNGNHEASNASSAPPPNAPREPANKDIRETNKQNTGKPHAASASSDARVASGANPRTKLTEQELASKMEKMAILNKEKTLQFQKAQRDETEHAEAMARSQEEARRRRAEEAAKRKVAEEERRRMDDERAKNRERKMAAMGMKESSWDEGKAERQQQEDRRATFRGGAHGGVRGTISARGGGLAGSRYADSADDDDNRRGDDRDDGYRGRGGGGRGRGRRGGRGGGGRTLFETDDDRDRWNNEPRNHNGSGNGGPRRGPNGRSTEKVNPQNPDEFPTLPSAGKNPQAQNRDIPKPVSGWAATAKAALPKTIDTGAAASQSQASAPTFSGEMPALSPLGKWDDEMAAMDSANN